jgi:hypothetical protein
MARLEFDNPSFDRRIGCTLAREEGDEPGACSSNAWL